jgi:hypothetical protein
MKKTLIMKVQKAGISIPMKALNGIVENDLIEINIEKLFVDEKIKGELLSML